MITAEEPPPCVSFSIQYTFVVVLIFFFLFACQKYILMLIVTSL